MGSVVRMVAHHDTLTPSTMGTPMTERAVLRAIRSGWKVKTHNGTDCTERWRGFLEAILPRP